MLPSVQFGVDNGLTFPLLQDNWNVYNQYYVPGGQSPYPRDIIIDQQGIVQYANNEYDVSAMELVIQQLLGMEPEICATGDINEDNSMDILDIVIVVNHVLGFQLIDDTLLCIVDLDSDGLINIMDIVMMVTLIL